MSEPRRRAPAEPELARRRGVDLPSNILKRPLKLRPMRRIKRDERGRRG